MISAIRLFVYLFKEDVSESGGFVLSGIYLEFDRYLFWL